MGNKKDDKAAAVAEVTEDVSPKDFAMLGIAKATPTNYPALFD